MSAYGEQTQMDKQLRQLDLDSEAANPVSGTEITVRRKGNGTKESPLSSPGVGTGTQATGAGESISVTQGANPDAWRSSGASRLLWRRWTWTGKVTSESGGREKGDLSRRLGRWLRTIAGEIPEIETGGRDFSHGGWWLVVLEARTTVDDSVPAGNNQFTLNPSGLGDIQFNDGHGDRWKQGLDSQMGRNPGNLVMVVAVAETVPGVRGEVRETIERFQKVTVGLAG